MTKKIFLEKLINIIKNREFQICMIALFISVLTYNVSDNIMHSDLDYSWEYAMNYFFINNLEHGKDIIWPYGPLGFLLFATPLWTFKYVAIFYFVLNYFLCYFLAKLFYETKSNIKYLGITCLAAVYTFSVLTNDLSAIIFLPLIVLLLYPATNRKRWFYLSSILAAVSFLLKTGMGVMSALSLFVYVIYELLSKSYEYKKYKQPETLSEIKDFFRMALIGCFLFFATLGAVWLIFYHNITGVFDYIYWQIILSCGYAQTLTFVFKQHYYYMLICSLIFAIFPFFLKNKEIKIFHSIILFSILLFIKYSLVRHTIYIFPIIFSATFLYIVSIKKLTKGVFCYIALLIFIMSGFSSFDNTKHFLKFSAKQLCSQRGPSNILNELWKTNNSIKDAQILSDFILHSSRISPDAKAYINNYSVDIYPFENTFAYSNNLNWTPRFLFHGYMTYTPELDKKNVEFLSSNKAPEYILWHKKLYDFNSDFAKRGVLSFDRKYVFNDDPQTMQAFLKYYGEKRDFGNVFVLKKLDNPIEYKKEYSQDFNFKYNEWIDVPQSNNNITLLSLKFKRTPYGKLMNLFSKDVFAYVDYEFFDNTITRYKLTSIDNLEAGMWVTPNIWEIKDSFLSRKVKRVRIQIDNPKTLENNITAKWIYIENKPEMWFKPDFSEDDILNNPANYKNQILAGKAGFFKKDEKGTKFVFDDEVPLKNNKKYIIQVEGSANNDGILYPKITAATVITNCNFQSDGHDFMLIFDNKPHKYNMLFKMPTQCNIKEVNINFLEDSITSEKGFNFKIFEIK